MAESSGMEVRIRSPAGKESDFTVSCGEEWTVMQLKEHIADVYPSKPPCAHQKLIFRGQLLRDHHVLKDVIQQDCLPPTIFLICSAPAGTPSSPSSATSISRATSCPAGPVKDDASGEGKKESAPASPASPSMSTAPVHEEGTELRHRPVASAAATSDTTSASTAPASSAAEQAAGTPSSQFGSASAYYQPSAYWPYAGWNTTASPSDSSSAQQQAYWAAYYQQYASHMSPQMWQTYVSSAAAAAAMYAVQGQQATYGWYPPAAYSPGQFGPAVGAVPNGNPLLAQVPPAAAAAAPGAGLNAAGGRAPEAARVDEPAPAMPAAPGANAGGLLGAVDEEEEDANQQPRMLRRIASIIRMAIMLSILYSFCTPSRFALLLVVTVLIRLYQAGAFRLQRARQRRQQMPDEAEMRAVLEELRNAQRQPRAREGAANEAGNRYDSDSTEEGESTSDTGSESESDEHPEMPVPPPAVPSTGRVFVSAVKAFVMSIFVEPEVAVN